jgi:hypothetical protein
MGVVLKTDIPTSTAIVSIEAKAPCGTRHTKARTIPQTNLFKNILILESLSFNYIKYKIS